MGSYYCGSMSPTNANATAADVSNFAVVGGVWDQWLTYVIVDKSTGLIRKSESIHEVDLRTISGDERYW
jgi:hypothetical protein